MTDGPTAPDDALATLRAVEDYIETMPADVRVQFEAQRMILDLFKAAAVRQATGETE